MLYVQQLQSIYHSTIYLTIYITILVTSSNSTYLHITTDFDRVWRLNAQSLPDYWSSSSWKTYMSSGLMLPVPPSLPILATCWREETTHANDYHEGQSGYCNTLIPVRTVKLLLLGGGGSQPVCNNPHPCRPQEAILFLSWWHLRARSHPATHRASQAKTSSRPGGDGSSRGLVLNLGATIHDASSGSQDLICLLSDCYFTSLNQ